jgi:hypothetical protein
MDGGNVLITWQEPFTGGIGVALESYTVHIYGGSGEYTEFPDLCDGSDADTFATR